MGIVYSKSKKQKKAVLLPLFEELEAQYSEIKAGIPEEVKIEESKPIIEYAEDTILVKFKPSTSIETINSLNLRYKALVINKDEAADVYRIKIPWFSTTSKMVEMYQKNSNVEWAKEIVVFPLPEEEGHYTSPEGLEGEYSKVETEVFKEKDKEAY